MPLFKLFQIWFVQIILMLASSWSRPRWWPKYDHSHHCFQTIRFLLIYVGMVRLETKVGHLGTSCWNWVLDIKRIMDDLYEYRVVWTLAGAIPRLCYYLRL
ncbi:unnamed protein product [Lactuca virosa]|uniref:Uncharacterized protein n=1 Tax=Lactuca virosa TaxID=75947 RepID=A0AAU9NXQ6_9ASTR|nr:unnamed protein product [Lactuca virosa]